MIGDLPESYDDWKARHEPAPVFDDDDRTAFERAIDRQIELERQDGEHDDNR